MKLLTVDKLGFRYNEDDDWLFKDLSFEIYSGDIISLTGNSGTGKSTLCYLLCGVIPHHRQGEILGNIKAELYEHKALSVSQLAPHISMVLQNPEHQLFFPTVEQELAFAAENLCLKREEIARRIGESLVKLDIEELRFMDTSKLSYGQQKLVALAAVNTLQPEILLLDEISNGLSESRQLLVKEFIENYAAQGRAVLFAEHDSLLRDMAEKNINLDKK